MAEETLLERPSRREVSLEGLGGARGPGEGPEGPWEPWEPSWGGPGGAEPWWPGWGPPDAAHVRMSARGPRRSWTRIRTAAGDEFEQVVEEGAVLAVEVDRGGGPRSQSVRGGSQVQDGGDSRALAVLQLVVDVVGVVVTVGGLVATVAALG